MAAGTQEKQYTPSLLSFFVYNPSFGPREGEVSLISNKWLTHVPLLCYSTCFISMAVFIQACMPGDIVMHRMLSESHIHLGGEEDPVLPPQ